MKKSVIIAVGIVAAGILWYAFRPELLFIDARVHEDLPAASAEKGGAPGRILARGTFKSVAHETRGVATIHELPGGRRILRLSDFETSNGPDVRVFLIAASDAADSEAVKRSDPIEVAKLKGNVGDQNYDLPEGVDLAKYRAVTIWRNRFSVNFGTAPLSVGAM